jgi:hypothetical protein
MASCFIQDPQQQCLRKLGKHGAMGWQETMKFRDIQGHGAGVMRHGHRVTPSA